jgi:hypothetical protein
MQYRVGREVWKSHKAANFDEISKFSSFFGVEWILWVQILHIIKKKWSKIDRIEKGIAKTTKPYTEKVAPENKHLICTKFYSIGWW